MPATTGMKGAGYYDQHSTAQLSTIQALQDWVEAAVANVPLPAPAQPVTVLDLGSSEGRNAIRLMGTIVAGLRRRTGQPIQTIYSDLASNNFNQLFANLEEARRAGLFSTEVYSVRGGRLVLRPAAAARHGPPRHQLQLHPLARPAAHGTLARHGRLPPSASASTRFRRAPGGHGCLQSAGGAGPGPVPGVPGPGVGSGGQAAAGQSRRYRPGLCQRRAL